MEVNWQSAHAPGGFLPVSSHKDKLGTSITHPVRCMEYDMVSLADQCVEAYIPLAGIPATKLSPKAQTPFVDETTAYTKDEPACHRKLLWKFS